MQKRAAGCLSHFITLRHISKPIRGGITFYDSTGGLPYLWHFYDGACFCPSLRLPGLSPAMTNLQSGEDFPWQHLVR